MNRTRLPCGADSLRFRATLLVLATVAVAACSGGGTKPAATGTTPPATTAPETLAIKDLAVGQGLEAVAGSVVTVHYTGWLYDPALPDNKGTKFDSSRDRGQPFRFTLGAGQVIRGWDEGVAGMKVGGQRRLVIPASLGYGERGAGGVIPPGATLLFDVELLGVASG
jgi:FKBP-type peptidyl-prolyl cis-trans isomerase